MTKIGVDLKCTVYMLYLYGLINHYSEVMRRIIIYVWDLWICRDADYDTYKSQWGSVALTKK
jgi:hypothetical protein